MDTAPTPTRPTRELTRLTGLVAFELLAGLALVELGRLPGVAIPARAPLRWLETQPGVVVTLGLLRWVTMALVGWLAVTTVAYVLARVSRVPALVRAAARVTPATVRRSADRVVAASLVAGTSVGAVPVPAAAAEVSTPPAVAVVAADVPAPPDVAAYWRELIDANRDRLRSGDPDLIHPGETLVLPPRPTADPDTTGGRP